MAGDNYRRGHYAEYHLAKVLLKHGYAVLRAPASGAKAKRFPYPDLIAWLKPRLLVFEVKRRKDYKAIYISEMQYNTLKFWQDRGAEAYIAVRFDPEGPKWFIVTLDKLETTDLDPTRRYRLPANRVLREGRDILDII